jgi:SynChlorMet cassette protein ScmD
LSLETPVIDRNSKPILNPDAVLRQESDDWAVLFDPDSGEAYALDSVGVFIAQRLDGNKSIMQIVRELGEFFENIPPEADEHALAFVNSLLEKGMAGFDLKKG